MQAPERPRRRRDYRRTYKACNNCRQKKIRCVPNPSGYLSGPCVRCNRESRHCIFETELATGTEKARHDRSNEQEAQSGSRGRSRDASTSGPVWDESETEPLRGTSTTDHSPILIHRRDGAASSINDEGATHSPAPGSSVLLTEVSCENDALDLLFRAADAQSSQNTSSLAHTSAHKVLPSDKLVGLWGKYHMVRLGWISAHEAIRYIDLFFQNLAPFSLILDDRYANHRNHHDLVLKEDFLCSVILMISSRYHSLDGSSGVSRGAVIHERLWDQCVGYIRKLSFGQDPKSHDDHRSNIQGLMLMAEWKPRAIHYPSPSSADELMDVGYAETRRLMAHHDSNELLVRNCSSLIESGRVSDNMSWMFLTCALGLAHRVRRSPEDAQRENGLPASKPEGLRLRKLLHILFEQLSLRLGFEPMTTTSFNSSFSAPIGLGSMAGTNHRAVDAWLELTRLTRLVSDIFLSSANETEYRFQSDRFMNMFHNLKEQLAKWKYTYAGSEDLMNFSPETFQIEYQYTRILLNSVAMRAIARQVLAQQDTEEKHNRVIITSTDYETIEEVIDGSRSILNIVEELDKRERLRFIPVRIVLRIVTASIFLLKALSLEPWNVDLDTSLAVLVRAIIGLRRIDVDDMHLGPRYAALLEVHVSRFKSTVQAAKQRKSRESQNSNSTGEQNADATESDQRDLEAGEDFDWQSLLWEPWTDPFILAGETGIQLAFEGNL